MKISVIKSSSHKEGASNLLADNFIKGAKESGHEIVVFDAAHSKVTPCNGCNSCGMNGPCIHKDDMAKFQDELLTSDMIVFATPLYYFGFSAQLKTVIDRFYNINSRLTAKQLKSALIVAAWDSGENNLKDVKSHYLTICRYMNFENVGIILGGGCGNTAMASASIYPQEAYKLGKYCGEELCKQ